MKSKKDNSKGKPSGKRELKDLPTRKTGNVKGGKPGQPTFGNATFTFGGTTQQHNEVFVG